MTLSPVDLRVDVTDAAGLGEKAEAAVTIFLPDPADMPPQPVVCFAFPGGGYSRGYFSFDMPGSAGGGEAGWHTGRGWVFVACDHLGVGDSTLHDENALLLDNVAAANAATVVEVLAQLRDGSLTHEFPALATPVVLGIGQSMGGSLLVVQEAQHSSFDGIGVLGYSAIHTSPPLPPGAPPLPLPFVPRGSDPANPTVANQAQLQAMLGAGTRGADAVNPMAWGFHYDDVPEDIVRRDMHDFYTRGGDIPPWGSATCPGLRAWLLTPGVIAPEASSIDVPLLLAFGERDVAADPWSEPKAYPSARDITMHVCPRMGHMHNFAGTREQFWNRIHSWGAWVSTVA
jgi:pimeloyl-ACP methyl ester carboxylesterase